MSRIGNMPVAIPDGVKVTIADGVVTVKGKSELSMPLPPLVSAAVEDAKVVVRRQDGERASSAMQGLTRSLVNNMIIGVTDGFRKELQIVGVGYRAQISGKKLVLNLGYSHPIEYAVPDGVRISVADNVKITVEGADKQLVGQVAATIRGFRQPEPYKGKGIRYADEQITLKEGKSVG